MPLAALAPTGDALDAARDLLPAWVVWGRIVGPLALVFLTQLCVTEWFIALLELRAGPKSGLHWTERARRIANLSPPLRAFNWCLSAPALFIPGLLVSEIVPIPGGVIVLATVGIAVLAGYLSGRRMRRRLFGQEISAREWRRASCMGLLTHWLPVFAFLSCLLFVGKHPGPAEVGLLLTCTVVLLWSAVAGAWRILPVLGLAQDIDVRGIVGDSGKGVRFLAFDSPAVNAYALPALGWVMVTQRTRELLTDSELAAVLHHELGHLAEPKRVLLMRHLPIFLYLTLAWVRPLLGWLGPHWTLELLVLGWIAAALVGKKAKKLEERADAHAHASVEDSRVYARALEKIGQANLSPAVTDEANTHPHLYDRMLSAGLTPDYPRPDPTRPNQPWRILLVIVVCIELAVVDSMTRPSSVERNEQGVLRALALGGWDSDHLRTLADLHEQRGDHAAADIFRAAAQEAGSQR